MTFDEAVQSLLALGHETLVVKLGLDNVRRLLAALSHPEQSFPSVQIAGTNGKGSTAVMLDAILHAASIRTGLYTSPHLVSITERIRIDGRDITRDDFARHTLRVRDAALTLRDDAGALPSFFEQVTAIALCAFRDARIDLAVLETGLGGRLDATTAALASVVAITPVALDHQEYLGTTLGEIAAEKAAIIRPGVEAVISAQEADALEVILARCRETNVAPRFATGDIRIEGATSDGRLRATFRTGEDAYESVTLSLRGRHQLANAATAISLAEVLRARGFTQVTRAAIVAGLEAATHPGRLELIDGATRIILDGAHNPAGALALRAYLNEFARSPFTIVFGAMRDKDLTEIAAALFPAADHLILTSIDNPRATAPDALRAFVPSVFDPAKVSLASSSSEALRMARDLTSQGGMICVTGSLYLVGEVKAHLARA
ncbi:MAG: dihydrofolate synthase / folylpolyglutamate synthase [Acidobacteriota bacterium]|nr:dihydrofolate synthase / folylpolyglutamate synthase [Acidobacteriota bacterium]